MPHCPMKFQYVRRRLSSPSLRILDIGCGNHSPSTTKRWFPGCHYTGADIERDNNSDQDVAAMDAFYLLGTDGSGYAAIPDGSYDSGCSLLEAEAGRIYLDCISFLAQPFAAFIGGRDAAVLRRPHACLRHGDSRGCQYFAGERGEDSARGPVEGRFHYNARGWVKAAQEAVEEMDYRQVFRQRTLVSAGI